MYDQETSSGSFSGHASMFLLGAQLRRQYGHLWDSGEKLPFFIASQERIVDTAEHVSRGFFGRNWRNQSQFVVLPETASQGLNSLTPGIGCPDFDYRHKAEYKTRYAEKGFKSTLKRFNSDLPGANLTVREIGDIMSLCLYDLNVVGESDLCGYFNHNDWVAFEYYRDLDYYYQAGPGNPHARAVGNVVTEASLKLLKESSTSNNSSSLILNFAHDTNLLECLNSFGIGFDHGQQHLGYEQITLAKPVSQLMPMGARVNLEKLSCVVEGNQPESFVRFVINDQVHLYPNCTTGPGFSCPIDEYIAIQESRAVDSITACGIDTDYSAAKTLTFYWDWVSDPNQYANSPTQ